MRLRSTRSALGLAASSLLAFSCGSSPAMPTPTPPAPFTLSGIISATNGGEPLTGAQVNVNGTAATIDGAGRYTLTLTHAPGTVPFSIVGAGLVSHTAIVTVGTTRTVNADAIAQDGTFDLSYYRQLARDGFDHPDALMATRRLLRAPRIYMRTIDEAGKPINGTTIAVVGAAFLNVGAIWSGGRFGIAGIDLGTETREGVPGFITVRWLAVSTLVTCGTSDVGIDGGLITLNAAEPRCRCDGSFAPRVAKHELGHAFGMMHTGSPEDVMFGSPQSCDATPSAREQYHAKIIYARPIGNTDPDNDPTSPPLLQPLRVH